jgi:hypothetical protein
MKTVIDAIHEDIQNRSRSEQETTSPQSSQNGSSHSSGAEKKKDSRELKRIESFMADATDITALIDGDIDEDAARRRMAEKPNEFDEMFEGAGKNKTS